MHGIIDTIELLIFDDNYKTISFYFSDSGKAREVQMRLEALQYRVDMVRHHNIQFGYFDEADDIVNTILRSMYNDL